MTTKNDDNSEARFRAKYEPRIKDVTVEGLPAFIAEMLADEIDYGTICMAVAFAGAAAAWAVERSPQGGVTGFQAGFIGWELLRQWGSPTLGKTGTRIVNFDDLLYPQYAYKFHTLSKETWEKVQAEAARLVAEPHDYAHPDVVAHWRSVADGGIPFGLKLEAE